MKKTLTDAFIKAAVPDSKRLQFWDQQIPGLCLRLTENGAKTFSVLYRINGRLRRLTLGSYPRLSLGSARDLAKRALAEVQLGRDPAAEKRDARDADTFGELAHVYIERHAKLHKRSWRKDQYALDRDLLPAWKSRKASEISRRDVIELLDRIVARGAGVLANRTKALVSKIFNFGILRGTVQTNPAFQVPRPGQEHQRDRVLSDSEIKALWEALDKEPGKIAAVFRLALLTAQRRGEILGLRWAELDLDAGWWTLPAERSKNKIAHLVPLGPQVLAILSDLREQANGSEYVFPSTRVPHLDTLHRPMKRLRKATGASFVFHDLRRTAASHMTAIGIQRLIVSKLLNHVEHGITAIYDRHSYSPEKQAALLKWDQRLAEIVRGTSGSLVAEAFPSVAFAAC